MQRERCAHRRRRRRRSRCPSSSLTRALAPSLCLSACLLTPIAPLFYAAQVSYEEGQALADSRNIPFIECSAKENINVTEVFTTLIREIERDNGTLDAEVRAWARVPILPPPLARSVALSPSRPVARAGHIASTHLTFAPSFALRMQTARLLAFQAPSLFASRSSLLAPCRVPWRCLCGSACGAVVIVVVVVRLCVYTFVCVHLLDLTRRSKNPSNGRRAEICCVVH
mmetsp:Transcript_27088/g.72969  ORF Transcript_27088/g.72969 Transcript_27088/m.72969 type:complete len:227 (-) Transcript_27088:102-782(-)